MTDATPPRALVVGLGTSGVAAAHLLRRQGFRVRVNDHEPEAVLAERVRELPEGCEMVLGGHRVDALSGVSTVVVSPGVPWHLPLLEEARRLGAEVIPEVELAWRALDPTPVLGVTGSNGKSTVTAMLGRILAAAGLRVGVGGNIGTAAAALALEGGWDAVVLELSSFQLEGIVSLRPCVAVILNVSPDHLDRHDTVEAYTAAKARITVNQRPGDTVVLNAEDPALRNLPAPSRRSFFALHDASADALLAGAELTVDGAALMRRAELPLLGDHNVANALAAALSALRFGVPRAAAAGALREFEGLPHRHRLVAEADGVRWVDDSKGTNIGATAAGLAGYPAGTIHLILGGLGKGQDFATLAPAVAGRVARAYLIGAAAGEMAAALSAVVPVEMCGTLEEAVRRARALATPGATVLLSPACASFDQFRDYGHRGDEFARLARAVTGES